MDRKNNRTTPTSHRDQSPSHFKSTAHRPHKSTPKSVDKDLKHRSKTSTTSKRRRIKGKPQRPKRNAKKHPDPDVERNKQRYQNGFKTAAGGGGKKSNNITWEDMEKDKDGYHHATPASSQDDTWNTLSSSSSSPQHNKKGLIPRVRDKSRDKTLPEMLPYQLQNAMDTVRNNPGIYTLQSDGGARKKAGANKGIAGAGFCIWRPDKELFVECCSYVGDEETSNLAEYIGLVLGIQFCIKIGIKNIKAKVDSDLIVGHIVRSDKCNNSDLDSYKTWIEKQQEEILESFDLTHVPRAQNKEADIQANIAMDKKTGQISIKHVQANRNNIVITEPEAVHFQLNRRNESIPIGEEDANNDILAAQQAEAKAKKAQADKDAAAAKEAARIAAIAASRLPGEEEIEERKRPSMPEVSEIRSGITDSLDQINHLDFDTILYPELKHVQTIPRKYQPHWAKATYTITKAIKTASEIGDKDALDTAWRWRLSRHHIFLHGITDPDNPNLDMANRFGMFEDGDIRGVIDQYVDSIKLQLKRKKVKEEEEKKRKQANPQEVHPTLNDETRCRKARELAQIGRLGKADTYLDPDNLGIADPNDPGVRAQFARKVGIRKPENELPAYLKNPDGTPIDDGPAYRQPKLGNYRKHVSKLRYLVGAGPDGDRNEYHRPLSRLFAEESVRRVMDLEICMKLKN